MTLCLVILETLNSFIDLTIKSFYCHNISFQVLHIFGSTAISQLNYRNYRINKKWFLSTFNQMWICYQIIHWFWKIIVRSFYVFRGILYIFVIFLDDFDLLYCHVIHKILWYCVCVFVANSVEVCTFIFLNTFYKYFTCNHHS